MARAMHSPVVMESKPYLFIMSFAFRIASISSMPHLEPTDPTVSYSGPSPESPANLPLFTTKNLLHGRGQELHAFVFTLYFSLRVSPLILSAFLKNPVLKWYETR